jgi:hypothetical protein
MARVFLLFRSRRCATACAATGAGSSGVSTGAKSGSSSLATPCPRTEAADKGVCWRGCAIRNGGMLAERGEANPGGKDDAEVRRGCCRNGGEHSALIPGLISRKTVSLIFLDAASSGSTETGDLGDNGSVRKLLEHLRAISGDR